MRAVRVLSLLVLAIVARCTSADLEGTCWSLGPAECFLRPGCEYCNFFGRKNVCIWDAVAEYIPTSEEGRILTWNGLRACKPLVIRHVQYLGI